VVDATVDDHRTVHEFSDAELTAILRRRVGVVPVESRPPAPHERHWRTNGNSDQPLVTTGAGAATGYLPTGLLPTGYLPTGYFAGLTKMLEGRMDKVHL
jgi:hypothetical protein